MTGNANALRADIRDESVRLTTAAGLASVPIKLMGGLAFWLRCPSVRVGAYARSYADLDFVVTAAAAPRARAFLVAEGYVPDQFFNGLHGASRLYYTAPDGRWSIDVVLDQLVMSHRLDLRAHIGGPEPTISLADLLLTKLQVWEITRKDLGDALCLLADHAIGESEYTSGDGPSGGGTDGGSTGFPGVLRLDRLRSVLAADWGFCHTAERNLGKVRELWMEQPLPAPSLDVAAQVDTLRRLIDATPKSVAWRARARIGERIRWYETPEEVRH
jgi:hypothetical protein